MGNILLKLLIIIAFIPLPSAMASCLTALEEFNNCTLAKNLCDEKLIWDYTANLYIPLNKTLRGTLYDENCLPVEKHLRAALENLPSVHQTVYRGTGLTENLNNLRINDCFSDPAFLSTSTKELTTKRFGETTLEIETITGKDISNLSAMAEEKEVVLLPGTPLKLIERSGLNFKFQEIAPEECSKTK